MIISFLSRVLNVRKQEWPLLLLLFGMACLFIVGIEWGSITVESAFLNQVGVSVLPFVFAGNALISIVAIAIYTAFADRVDDRRLLIAISGIGVAAIAAGLSILVAGMTDLAYTVLYLVFVGVLNTFALHWWTFVNGFYDIRSAKRIVPVLASSNRVASGIAGLTVPFLNRTIAPGGIIFVWMSTLAAVAVLAWLLPRILTGQAEPAAPLSLADSLGTTLEPATPARGSYFGSVREGFRYVSQSAFLRWMALATLVLTLLLTFLNYRTSVLLVEEFGSQAAIANFVGLVTGVANFVMLPIQLLVLSRIVARIGLGSATLIYPVATFGITASLIAFPGRITAGLAYFDRSTLRTTFQSSLEALLYNAVPAHVKGRARAFISGLVVPLGTILGGLLLLARNATTPAQAAQILSILLLACATAYLLISWVIRRQYQRALIEMLEQEDYSFLLTHTAGSLKVTDAAGLKWLAQKLEAATRDSPGVTAFLAQLIARVGGNEAIDILHKAALTSGPEASATILDVLADSDLRSAVIAPIFREFLNASDVRVRRSAVAGWMGIVRADGAIGEVTLAQALALLDDPDPEVRALVLPVLINSPHTSDTPAVRQALGGILDSSEARRRMLGVRVLSQVGSEQVLERLLGFLTDPDDGVRVEAAVVMERKVTGEAVPAALAKRMCAAMVTHRDDPVERIRQAAVVVVGRLGDEKDRERLGGSLVDPSPGVRSAAVDALAAMGPPAVAALRPMLLSADLRQRAMATAVAVRVERHHREADVQACVDINLRTTYSYQVYRAALTSFVSAGRPGVQLLLNALHEQDRQLLDDIFFVLDAAHPDGKITTVVASLRSDNTRARTNAYEALESLTNPQVAAQIAPLSDPTAGVDDYLRIAQTILDEPHVDVYSVFAELVLLPRDSDAKRGTQIAHPTWLRAIAVYAIGDLCSPWPMKHSVPGGVDDLAAPGAPKWKSPMTRAETEALVRAAAADPAVLVREAAQATMRLLADSQGDGEMPGTSGARSTKPSERWVAKHSEQGADGSMLTTIERMIFLKEVSFFQDMTVEQLQVLASVCDEIQAPADARIFNMGDLGGALYVIVDGKVAIEREAARKGSSVRLSTLGPRAYFGEMNLFNDSARTETAISLQDTHILRVRREPIIALCRQQPDLALELINVLSERLAETTDQIAGLTRTRPRELHQFFDKLS